MPEKVILKRVSITCLTLLVLSSINPTGYFFGDSSFAIEASSYLSQQDIAYNSNLAQLVATDEGFLVKNMPQQQDSVIVERVDFVEHEVQRGETIETVAQLYKISPETIIWENEIVSIDSVKTGDRLRIPPADGVTHTVQRGDTLLGLAVKYESDTERISKYNQINQGLKVGATIFVPGGKRVSTQLIADNTPTENSDTPSNQPTRVANIQTDINANIMPSNAGFETPQSRPSTPDARPNPNVAPIQGIQSTTSISRDADPRIAAPRPEQVIRSVPNPVDNVSAPATSGVWGKATIGNITQGYRSGHFALDIANRSRPPVWATADGVVETAGWGGAYGNYIIIDHQNGFKTLYAHNSDLYVKAGDSVSKGQVISQMGNTGRVYGATGIHLHYECHQDGVRINPYNCME
jgi:murein DD-endopeptidase MepM/ murein hydrolase activator NlpD